MAATTYTAQNGETVYYDADSGPWTFALPVNPQNGWQVNFKETGVFSQTPIIIDGNGKNVELFDYGLNLPTISFYPTNDLLAFQFNAGRDTWVSLGAIAQVEVWQLTPIIGMAGQTIQWTFVPLAPGETPVLVSHAAGVLTFNTDATLQMQMNIEVDMIISSNNADVDYSITPNFTSGSGVSLFARIVDSFAHSRAGIFPRSNVQAGPIAPRTNDTISFVANSAGTSGSTVDLTAGFLMLNTNA